MMLPSAVRNPYHQTGTLSSPRPLATNSNSASRLLFMTKLGLFAAFALSMLVLSSYTTNNGSQLRSAKLLGHYNMPVSTAGIDGVDDQYMHTATEPTTTEDLEDISTQSPTLDRDYDVDAAATQPPTEESTSELTPSSSFELSNEDEDPIRSDNGGTNDDEDDNDDNDDDTDTAASQDVAIDILHQTKRGVLHEKSVAKREFLRQEATMKNSEPPNPVDEEWEWNVEHACDEPIDGKPGESGGWTPPENASAQNVLDWNDAYDTALERIQESNLGGEELRALAAKEVEQLNALRDSLFCSNENNIE